jgi:GntR family transcriptional regulator
MTSTIQLYVNPGDDLPIYRQIVIQVTDAIAVGRLSGGARLPSHRELAAQLVIAPLTVKKAYDELERGGLILSQRGRGTFVAESPAAIDTAPVVERLRETARRMLADAAVAGIPYSQVVELLEEARKGMES